MTRDEIGALRAWHEHRLIELRYPQAVKFELRTTRERWLATVKRTQQQKADGKD